MPNVQGAHRTSPPSESQVRRLDRLPRLRTLLRKFATADQGQDLIEYALLGAFVTLSGIGVLMSIGSNVGSIYGRVSSSMGTAAQAAGGAGGASGSSGGNGGGSATGPPHRPGSGSGTSGGGSTSGDQTTAGSGDGGGGGGGATGSAGGGKKRPPQFPPGPGDPQP